MLRHRHGGGSNPPNGAFALGGHRCPAPPGCAVMPAGSGSRRVQDRVEGLLGAGGIVAVGLGQISMHRLHVLRQPPQAQPQHPRGQVRYRARCQDDEARVVRDQMQAPELLLRAPADPVVARGQLERAGLPADERELARAHGRDMAQALAEYAMKRQIVMGRHQPVPAPVFLRAPGRTHRDRAQINATSRCRQRSHARHTATSKTKWPVPASAAAASPSRCTNKKIALAWCGVRRRCWSDWHVWRRGRGFSG